MKYIYTHTRTEGTTGYFECLPDPAPDLAQALDLLLERPRDVFLYRYVVKLLLQCCQEEYAAFIEQAVGGDHAIWADVLLRVLELRQGDLAIDDAVLRALRQCAAQLSAVDLAQPHCRLSGAASLSEILENLRRNIHAHRPVPDGIPLADLDLASYADEWQNMRSRQGKLARYYRRAKGSLDAEPRVEAANLKETCRLICEVLEANHLAAGPEMRHEASLSPIALLRSWNLRASVRQGRNKHELAGVATAYGRGLSLAQARVSCNMEIIERASAHVFVEDNGGDGKIGASDLRRASWLELAEKGVAAIDSASPGADARAIPLHWLPGVDANGKTVFAPAQAVYLFCNLDEPAIFEHIGSTGLAAGTTPEAAKLAALTEIIERYAQATTPFLKEDCFELESRDPVINGLLEDYRWRGIRVQFQDIATEIGLPVYRCFVYGHKGEVAQATGAGLRGARAALAAMTETPWPYIWARPAPAPSGPGLANLPRRFLEDLPDYSLGDVAADLQLLENALLAMGLTPVYVDISRPECHFPVYRAFLPGLEVDAELETGSCGALLSRFLYQKGYF